MTVETWKMAGLVVLGLYLLSFGAASVFYPRKLQSDHKSPWWFILFISMMPARMNPVFVQIQGVLMLLMGSVIILIIISAYMKVAHL